MERQSATRYDEQIGKMATALRNEPMPDPPAALMNRGPARRSVRSRPTVLILGAITLVAALSATVMRPEPSAAAMLARIALAGDHALRHEIQYEQRPDGSWKTTMETYFRGDRMRLVPHDDSAETFIEANERYDYFPAKGYAIMQPTKPRTGAWFHEASLKEQLDATHLKWAKYSGRTRWRGEIAARYDMHSEGVDSLGQMLSFGSFLPADPKSDRPYYEQTRITGDEKGYFKGGRTVATEWRYPAQDDGEASLRLPATTRIYEPQKLREQFKVQVTGNRGSATVDGIKVILRAVYVDDWGNIDVFTTGGTGRMENYPAGLRVNGKESTLMPGGSWGATSAGQNHGHSSGGKFVFEPLDYRGLKLVYQAANYGRNVQFPDVIDLEVPVFRPDASPGGRHFAGYAKFPQVTPFRINGPVLSDMMNRSTLWSDKDLEIDRIDQETRFGATNNK